MVRPHVFQNVCILSFFALCLGLTFVSMNRRFLGAAAALALGSCASQQQQPVKNFQQLREDSLIVQYREVKAKADEATRALNDLKTQNAGAVYSCLHQNKDLRNVMRDFSEETDDPDFAVCGYQEDTTATNRCFERVLVEQGKIEVLIDVHKRLDGVYRTALECAKKLDGAIKIPLDYSSVVQQKSLNQTVSGLEKEAVLLRYQSFQAFDTIAAGVDFNTAMYVGNYCFRRDPEIQECHQKAENIHFQFGKNHKREVDACWNNPRPKGSKYFETGSRDECVTYVMVKKIHPFVTYQTEENLCRGMEVVCVETLGGRIMQP